MEESKKWYLSKGVWSNILIFAFGAYDLARVSVAPQFGYELPEIPNGVFVFLGAMGIHARVTANKKIG